ncbi:hypothetical protein C7999DRAFT_35821 [Corynascus novoguineensis]|uniref:Rhodopsin domain-containing protein n=1 Tax=Corynascus novoguineensis TaxID=1126955 RepID=A0AAN7CKP3_9PEZI|nr:hypothetical protein C7999DRAFT_35821 [Corynascus novoguineensis]
MATSKVVDTRANQGPDVFTLPPSTDFGPQFNSTIWLLTALSSAFLALRVYCKFKRHRGLWWDDYLLIGSWLALVADCAFISASITLGLGRPLTQFNFANLGDFLLFSNFAGSFSILAALWSKTSFAVTVLRISTGWIRAFVWFIIITVNACLGVAIAITWAQCMPIEKVWHPYLEGTCWPKIVQIRYNIFTAVYSGAMDIVLAILPWKIIWTLTMNRKEKVGVMVAMSMGIFAGITSIVKITQLPSISNATFTEATTQLVILAAAESAITIVAASIPILRALVRDSGMRPPPDPPSFYHPLESTTSASVNGGGDADGMAHWSSMYAGTPGERGTGRSHVVISSAGRSGHRRRSGSRRDQSRSRSRSRSTTSSSGWSKEVQLHHHHPPHQHQHHRTQSPLGGRELSGLSVLAFAGGDRPSTATGSADRSLSDPSSSVPGNTINTDSKESSLPDMVELPPSPPPGKIVTTEEVVVEYAKYMNSEYPVGGRQGQR